jgi:diguanylate cyclase (GGDEF)-like protein
MKLLSLGNVIFRIALIIAIAEFVVMQLLAVVPHNFSIFGEALLDTILLTILSTPFIYYLVIKPFVVAHSKALEELTHTALTDPVTKLANRSLITSHLEKCIARSFRHKNYGALISFDLDGFKAINDTYGHVAGDELLADIGKKLETQIRAGDLAGRLGGDEFILLFQGIGTDMVTTMRHLDKLAIKLLSVIQEPFNYRGENLRVSASMGIRVLGMDLISVEKALTQADEAMYNAKKAGKDQAKYYGQELHLEADAEG